jgi:hypothetical protein
MYRKHHLLVIGLNSGTPITTTVNSASSLLGGRLSQFFLEWTTLSIANWLLQTIQFHTNHPQPMIPYNTEQQLSLHQEIQSLLQKGAVEVVSQQQQLTTPRFYSPLFVIPKKNGGHRPVFNFKKLNSFITAPHFKMETLQDVTRTIQPNNWMTSIDLSDAFLHIPVHPQLRRFLRFRWNNITYQFKMTPFGYLQKLPNLSYNGPANRISVSAHISTTGF